MEFLIDCAGGIRLCGGNRELYFRMLSLFCKDPTASRLDAALLRDDMQDAFVQAHTLKGLAAQLALPALYGAASPLCDVLRAQQPGCLQDAQPLIAALQTTYRETLREVHLITAP